MFFQVKMQHHTSGDRFQFKLQKTAELTYWQAKKEQTRYRVTHLEVSEEKQKYD